MKELDNLKKEASIIGSMLGGLGVHLAQNKAAKMLINSPHAEDMYKHMFNAGVRGINPEIGKNISKGIAGALVPEVDVIGNIAYNFGNNMRKGLEGTPLKSYSNLTPDHKQFLQHLAGGDFHKVAEKIHEPEYQHLTSAFAQGSKSFVDNPNFHEQLDKLSKAITDPNNTEKIKLLQEHFKNSPKTLTSLSDAYKGSYLQKSLPKIFGELNQKEINSLTEGASKNNSFNKTWGAGVAASTITNNALLAAVEPWAATINSGKKFMMSDTAKKIPFLKNIKDKMYNFVVKKPLQKAWEEGQKGEFQPAKKNSLHSILFRDVINPLDFDMEQLSGKLSQAIHEAPEMQLIRSGNTLAEAANQMKNTGNKGRYARASAYQSPKIQKALQDMGYDTESLSGNLNYGLTRNKNIEVSGSKNLDWDSMIFSAPKKAEKFMKERDSFDYLTGIDSGKHMNTAREIIADNPRVTGQIQGLNIKSMAKSLPELTRDLSNNNRDEMRYQLSRAGIII